MWKDRSISLSDRQLALKWQWLHLTQKAANLRTCAVTVLNIVQIGEQVMYTQLFRVNYQRIHTPILHRGLHAMVDEF